MSDETTPGLRERIVKALTGEHYRRSHQGILASPEIHSAAMADAALAVVQPELDRRDAERDRHCWRIARVRAMAQVWIDIRPDYPTATQEGRAIAWAGQQIIAALDQPGDVPAPLRLREPTETELAAVREWVAALDPRKEAT